MKRVVVLCVSVLGCGGAPRVAPATAYDIGLLGACPAGSHAMADRPITLNQNRVWCEDDAHVRQGPYLHEGGDCAGRIREEGMYLDGERDGTWRREYGGQTSTITYRGGIADGVCETLAFSGTLREGKVDGPFTLRRVESDLDSQPEMAADGNGCHHRPPRYSSAVVAEGIAIMGTITDPAIAARVAAAFGADADLTTLTTCR